ncbi:MAG TPA: bifunctional alpha,alpha-trehalose-phosphate synthase (UDP-forming)/trehalose-phosphatase [Vicinamibacterales bacterium]|nr:bifunctional alpha,alpha-trehalose-phosphate synthase (UDP-forming)/trehalose-phosphatase [Vicinamibacterales bacterium]
MPNRLVIASNRLPVSTEIADGEIVLSPASGGVATGLRAWHERSSGVWVGWPGTLTRLSKTQRQQVDAQLAARHIVPVHLTRREVREYYDEFSNGVLWPVFHYLIDRLPLEAATWESYRRVNEHFADRIAEQYQPGDLIWVHDYQLLLVPGLLRQRLPDARIGFFLHIPFPAGEVFRILPWRRDILEGLLGADLIGFHTYSYVQHFAAALSDVSGTEPEDDRVWVDDRPVRLGVFPMGIDATAFRDLASSADVDAQVEMIRREARGRRILLGVDRLDYTKGISRRLLALEHLLRDDPSFRERIRLIQVAVPSRDAVPSYQELSREVDGLIGRINGTYGTATAVPIHYLHQSVTREQLVALYRAADVMLVTPLRDGMNLVAKEYVASRTDDDGVLVLSEFAGAAEELHEAVLVNAYDTRDLAAKIRNALDLGPDERARRMRTMRRRVMAHDVHRWADEFVRALERDTGYEARATPEEALKDVTARVRTADVLDLLLDYDGTLVPIARTPEQAAPDAALRRLVTGLAERPRTHVHIVSGRPRPLLEEWLAALPVTLWAEHGIWVRPEGETAWQTALDISHLQWLDRARALMEEFAADTPGAFVEEKSASIAWHYREATRAFGAAQARKLRVALAKTLSDAPIDVLEGKKLLEVRPRGAGKSIIMQWLLSHEPAPTLIVAFGDDRTDEEMFAALPPGSVSVHIGRGATMATHRLRDWTATRNFLSSLIA